LAAKPSRDLITAAHQQITHEWWSTARDRFELYVSEAVLNEIRLGDPKAAVRRLELVADLDALSYSSDVEALIGEYAKRLGFEGSAATDLPHLAYAVAYEMDYLVSWNCRHIANGKVIKRLTEINQELQRHTPVIVTPEEILEFYPEAGLQ
jgi:hypothetical protein